ncbi:Heme A synthase [Pseudoalteromonas sp. P1-9]|uniref:COX15/CtaA family protein n=1 Tax=Pseudoalteromonas sp. P1-9 TaxID=1710354 RepID=UPI0006D5DECD|nr:COX15/CtaA family protein [Pseudoalteromonas sp. P1-9]KPV98058.1 Heme A synthase [Pseudoalteromonas sp. P1-9]
MNQYHKIVLFGCIFAFIVVGLGAYTRLSDSGLGCPDWPGCYGFLTVPNEVHELEKVETHFPTHEVDQGKAWKEMIHRYFAGTLGIIILLIAIMAFKQRQHRLAPVKLPLLILGLVVFQAALGMLTVTMNLQPLIVMGHLLGGFTIMSLLFLLYIRLTTERIPGGDSGAKPHYGLAIIALCFVVSQIALGGWLAANYAASHCADFPLCGASTFERFSFTSIFQLPNDHASYEFGVLSAEARMSIHFFHRIWAMVTTFVVLWVGFKILKDCYSTVIKRAVYHIWVVLFCQIGLGVSLILMHIPLNIALIHNMTAVLLLLSCVRLAYLIKSKC